MYVLEQKLEKIGIPLHTPSFHIKVGFNGVYITRTCFHDVPKDFTLSETQYGLCSGRIPCNINNNKLLLILVEYY